MHMKLLGFRRLDFVTDDGSAVKGTQLFTSHQEDGVTGETIAKLFIREGVELPPLSPGMVLDVAFTNKGRVEAVKTATAPGAKS